MNLEIAQRLQQLRKQHGYSQEGLAEKLGLSRQAVSKWERAESSPDTDNLIELAKLYGVSLDELLLGRSAEEAEAALNMEAGETSPEAYACGAALADAGIRAAGEPEEAGAPETDNAPPDGGAKPESGGKTENRAKRPGGEARKRRWHEFPYPVLTLIGFLIWGFCGGWAVSWTLFLTVPLYYTLIEAVQKRNAHIFCYPVLVTFVFFLCGMLWDVWHPLWVLFLTIPLYYGLIEIFR